MMSLFALSLGICILALTGDSTRFDIFVSLTLLLFTIAFVFDISKSKKMNKYSAPIFSGYFLRIVLLFYDVYSSDPLHLPLVGGELSSDPLNFYNAAVSYSMGNSIRYGGYFSKLLGKIFSITGASRLWGESIVMLFSVATVLVLVTIVEELETPLIDKKKGVYLISLLPNYAFLSVVLRRETLITFFVSLSILFFIRWFKNTDGERAFLLSIIFALMASLFHGATGMIVASYIMVRILYSPKKKAYTLDLKNIIGAALFAALIMFIYGRFGTVFFGKIERMMNADAYSITRDAGGSSYAKYVGDSRTPIRMLIFAVPRFMYYMFSPFPWQWRGINDIITFLFSSCVYLFIIINTIRYITRIEKDDENRKLLIALLIIGLVTASIFSWGVTNTGTATRHRDKFIVLFTIMFTLSKSLMIKNSAHNNSISGSGVKNE